MAGEIRKKIQLILDKRKADKTEADAKKALGGVEKGLGRLKKAALAVGGALAAAFAIRALVRFGKESIRVAAESEEIWTRLAVAIDNTGESFNDLEGDIKGMARAVQDLTTLGDEDFAVVLTELVTTTNDYQRSLQNVGVVLDLSIAKQIDLKTAAQLVGRAMVGQTSTLTRYGILIEEGQDAVEVLRNTFKGFAEKEGKTFGGRIRQLSNEWSDFKQAVGEALIAVGGGTSILEKMIELVKDMTAWVDANKLAFQRWGSSALELLERVGGAILRKLDQLDPVGKMLREEMKGILDISQDQVKLDAKRLELALKILETERERQRELRKSAALRALIPGAQLLNLGGPAAVRAGRLEEQIQALQSLIEEIDRLQEVTAEPTGAPGPTPAPLGVDPEEALTLRKIWETYPAVMLDITNKLRDREKQTELLAGAQANLNSEMEVSAENAAIITRELERMGQAAELTQTEMLLIGAAGEAARTITAGVFGGNVGQLARWKAEQNAIMAAEQLAMAAASFLIPGLQGKVAGHLAAAKLFGGVAAAWAALAGATGGFKAPGGGGGGAAGGPRDVGGAASERAAAPGAEIHIHFVGPGFDATNPEVQRIVFGSIEAAEERFGPNASVKIHRKAR